MIFKNVFRFSLWVAVCVPFCIFVGQGGCVKNISTEIVIKASPEKVWRILMDFEIYPQWNPFIQYVFGEKQIGSVLKVRVQSPGKETTSFEPVVLSVKTNQELRWRGQFLMPGLFDGEHSFVLKDNGDGTTTFRQNEEFKGIIVCFYKTSLDKTEQGFHLMNKVLKERCENAQH